MGDGAAVGCIYRAGERMSDLSSTRIVGASLETWPPRAQGAEEAAESDPLHDRLIRGFGAGALARLRSARIGVVGAGGGGSHVIQQLAYLGVGILVPVDGDLVELTNLNRLVGAFPRRRRRSLVDRLLRRGQGDVGKPKVQVMDRLIRRVSWAAQVETYSEPFPSPATANALRKCDLIVAALIGFRFAMI